MTNEELYKMWRESDEANWLVWLDQNIEWVNEDEYDKEFQEKVGEQNGNV
jgi:hypothetical protein